MFFINYLMASSRAMLPDYATYVALHGVAVAVHNSLFMGLFKF